MRLPKKSELGTSLKTYVKDGQGELRQEAETIIDETKVIARNLEPIGIKDGVMVFNE